MATDTGTRSTDSDLISNLPDPILHCILGLLKTKQAVQTCVLSKRWEHLWAFLPSLHFDYKDFEPDLHDAQLQNSQWYEAQLKSSSERFAEFVNMVLLRRESSDLDMFRLSGDVSCLDDYYSDEEFAEYADDNVEYFSDDQYEDRVKEWIHYAVRRNTRVLHLLSLPPDSLPCSIYTCASLEELYLFDCQINTSRIVNLPNLRKLRLHDVGKDYNVLHTGCKVLESLRVENCLFHEYLIVHESLKHLAILNGAAHGTPLSVNAPKLLSFSYYGPPPLPSEGILNMPSLVYANLKIHSSGMTEICEELAHLLSALTSVELLDLQVNCCYWQELPAVVMPELPTFQKLEVVRATLCRCSCFRMLTWILKSMPNLKKLTLLLQECGASKSESVDASPTIALSPCKDLEIVEVKFRKSDRMVGRLVDALLDGTRESESLKIVLSKLQG